MRFSTSVSLIAAVVVAGTTVVLANEIDETNSVYARELDTDLVLEARAEALDNYIRELEASDLELREFSEGPTEALEARKSGKGRKHKKKKHGGKKGGKRRGGKKNRGGQKHQEGAADASAVDGAAEGGATEGGEAVAQEAREYLESRRKKSGGRPRTRTSILRKIVNGKNINKAADAAITANKVANNFVQPSQENHMPRSVDYLEARARTKSNSGNRNRPNKNAANSKKNTNSKKNKNFKSNRPNNRKGSNISQSKGAGRLVGAGIGLFHNLRQHNNNAPQPEDSGMEGRDQGIVLDARDLLSLNEALEMRED